MAGMVIYIGVGPHVRVVSSGRLCREETGRDHSVLPFPPHIYTYIQVPFAFPTTYIYIYNAHIYIYIYIYIYKRVQ